jgi:succinate dehydrogenase hydrophobic anchor subunit
MEYVFLTTLNTHGPMGLKIICMKYSNYTSIQLVFRTLLMPFTYSMLVLFYTPFYVSSYISRRILY